MKLSRLLLSTGISLTIIMGGGSLLKDGHPSYYLYLGLAGVVLIIAAVIRRRYENKDSRG